MSFGFEHPAGKCKHIRLQVDTKERKRKCEAIEQLTFPSIQGGNATWQFTYTDAQKAPLRPSLCEHYVRGTESGVANIGALPTFSWARIHDPSADAYYPQSLSDLTQNSGKLARFRGIPVTEKKCPLECEYQTIRQF